MQRVDGTSGRNFSAADFQSESSQFNAPSNLTSGGGNTDTKQYSPFNNENSGGSGSNTMGQIGSFLQEIVSVLSNIVSLLSSMFSGGNGNGGASGGGNGSGGFGSGGSGGGSEGSGGSGGSGGYSGGSGGGSEGSGRSGGSGGYGGGSGGGSEGSGRSGGSGGYGGGSGGGSEGSGRTGGSGGPSQTPEPEDTTNQGKVTVVDKPIVVDGGVFDGQGATFTASSSLGDGGQSEGQKPIFILKNGATLKNVTIGENGADGVHVFGGATLKNVNWKDVGEDALTVKSSGDVNIIGGSAANASDKVFQINADTNFYVKDFKADGFQTFVRTNGGQAISANVTIDGGEFSNGKTLFRTDSKTSEVQFVGQMDVQNVAVKERYWDQKTGF